MRAGSSVFAFRFLLAALIIWLQAFSLAHAAEHGDEPHDHDGVECDLTVYTTEDMGILPGPAAQVFAPPVAPSIGHVVTAPADWTWPPERGPPPRGPPTIQQQ